MSNLQVLAHRCPVMGQAMAVQSARTGVAATGLRAFSSHTKASKARIHTSRLSQARTVDAPIIEGHENGAY